MTDRATHEAQLRTTLANAMPIAYFHTPGDRRYQRVDTMPKGRVCAEAGCRTVLSIYNKGKYCDLCVKRIGYQVREEEPARPLCACGEPCDPKRSDGRPNGWYAECHSCRHHDAAKTCARCGEAIARPRYDKRYCGKTCRRAAAREARQRRAA